MYKPYHLIGLELNISILSAALRFEPTGQPHGFRGDVAAVAKRDLRAGEMLDGEGGYTVWGKLMPAAASLTAGALPIGLAHRVKLKSKSPMVRWCAGATSRSTPATRRSRRGRRWKRRSAASLRAPRACRPEVATFVQVGALTVLAPRPSQLRSTYCA